MTKFLGIEFAPLHIPLERRLQTTAVCIYVFIFLQGISFISLLTFTGLLFTRFYWISLLYAAWYVYDFRRPQQGGRASSTLRRWRLWKYVADFFPIELVKTVDLDPNKNYVMGVSPHAIMCFSSLINFGTEATGFSDKFPGLTPHLITLNAQFFSPIMREFVMSSGSLSASRESLKYALSNQGNCKKKGQVCAILVGGAREALEAYPGRYRLILKNRKGFVRIALETGASLVPVFLFGENDVYNALEVPEDSLIRQIQITIKRWTQFGLPIIRGRGIFNYNYGIVPYRKPTYTVIGKPIETQKTDNPTPEQIDKFHDIYVNSLIDLFNEHKHKYCPDKDIKLEII